jgi:hypothetical protein
MVHEHRYRFAELRRVPNEHEVRKGLMGAGGVQTMNIEKHMQLLGRKVTDRVTGAEGVATAISFDLYGCIQAIVTPAAGKDGKREEGQWYDVQRLRPVSMDPVMELPDYDFGYVAEGRKGPAEKPRGRV